MFENRMMKKYYILIWIILLGAAVIACADVNTTQNETQSENATAVSVSEATDTAEMKRIIGLHTSVCNDAEAEGLIESLPKLAERGINLVIVEVGYCFQYKTHPELGEPEGLSLEAANRIAEAACAVGIEIVPEINCLGHQSWEDYTCSLLTVYPELDETPNKFPNNEDIYCRSWCPLNETVNIIIFDLIDELIDAFSADAFHVGMDEVFIIADDDCPRCHGKDAGELFAKQIIDLYQHIVIEKGAAMYMWADRLLDGQVFGDAYSEWEASYNGTYTAIDLIPKDIIMCDWHYEAMDDYPSVAYLTSAGFQVLTASWNDADAAEQLITVTMDLSEENDRVLGHIYTTWGEIDNEDMDGWGPMVETIHLLNTK